MHDRRPTEGASHDRFRRGRRGTIGPHGPEPRLEAHSMSSAERMRLDARVGNPRGHLALRDFLPAFSYELELLLRIVPVPD